MSYLAFVFAAAAFYCVRLSSAIVSVEDECRILGFEAL